MAVQRNGLFNAPPDVLNAISYFISGIEILLLWFTGSKRLLYTMSELGGVKRLVLKTNGLKHLDSWPLIIPSFKRLEELKLHFGCGNVVNGNMKAAFESWPKSIRKLTLSFRDAESCWKHVDASVCFPNLEDLELDGWSAFLGTYLHKMPNLQRLSLTGNRSAAVKKIIDLLPQGFKHLELSFNPSVLTEELKALPATLKTLDVGSSHMTRKDIAHLPRSLTSASIFFNKLKSFAGVTRDLPPGLINLTISGYAHDRNAHQATINLDAKDLPSTLESFNMLAGIWKFKLKDLPQGLTQLKVPYFATTPMNASEFPPRITSLTILEPPEAFTDHNLEILPKTLTSLHIGGRKIEVTDEAIAHHLPPNLTALHIPYAQSITGKCFALLPRSLYHLELGSVDVQDANIGDLPHFVESLYLPNAKHLTNACARLLPRGLTVLVITDAVHFNFACVPDLPLYIGKLDLGQTGVAEKYNNDRDRRSRRKQHNLKLLPDPITPEQQKLLDKADAEDAKNPKEDPRGRYPLELTFI